MIKSQFCWPLEEIFPSIIHIIAYTYFYNNLIILEYGDFIKFEPVTLVPFEPKLIIKELALLQDQGLLFSQLISFEIAKN